MRTVHIVVYSASACTCSIALGTASALVVLVTTAYHLRGLLLLVSLVHNVYHGVLWTYFRL